MDISKWREKVKTVMIETIVEDVFYESSSTDLLKTWNSYVDFFIDFNEGPSFETL